MFRDAAESSARTRALHASGVGTTEPVTTSTTAWRSGHHSTASLGMRSPSGLFCRAAAHSSRSTCRWLPGRQLQTFMSHKLTHRRPTVKM